MEKMKKGKVGYIFEENAQAFLKRCGVVTDLRNKECMPDFQHSILGYVECTVMEEGVIASPKIRSLNKKNFGPVDIESIIDFCCTRISNRLQEKKDKYSTYIVKKRVDEVFARLVCLTAEEVFARDDYAWNDTWEDALYLVLYKKDINKIVLINEFGFLGNSEKKSAKKINSNGKESETPIGLFLNESYDCITGVLFVFPRLSKKQNDGCNIITASTENGASIDTQDTLLFLNPQASRKYTQEELTLIKKMGIKIIQVGN